ncbi:kinase-like domain-containing protein [Pilobolus umbonatus]|nr:kinase-like domain-containing protein [Pilobolus umbonatus]
MTHKAAIEEETARVNEKMEQTILVMNKAVELRKVLKDRNAQLQCDSQIRQYQRFLDYFDAELEKLKTRSESEETESPTTRKYTNLDLLDADIPMNKAKVSHKLHELEYKLDVEKKVQEGIKNLSTLIEQTTTADKRRREIQAKQLESQEKMTLLTTSVRKYKDLYVGASLREFPETFIRRHPATGKLQLSIVHAKELAHAPTRMFKDPSTAVMIKIDGTLHSRTKASKQDQWTDTFEVHVDKATEVELVIYDQEDHRSLPIGLLWLKISDIAESLRRQKLEDDSKKGLSAWFDVEPIGRIYLDLDFVRENVKKRPMDKLKRADAVRERKGEVHEMNGHHFIAKRFYHIMKCALCGDFMTKLAYQCEDCGFACHKKCYGRVVIRCTATPQLEHTHDEIKHHIPHRFDPLTIIGANWCCHCGFMLPLGFKGAQRCVECQVVCHTKCSKWVPDFCGMSMEKANLMLNEMKAANYRRQTIHAGSLQKYSLDEPMVIQPSKSTPLASKKRPVSYNHDGSSSPTLTNVFSTLSVSDRLPQWTTPVQVNRKVELADFNLLAVLGKGNFGKVMLAEEKYTRELYAIKILKKRFILDNEEVESTRSEKRVFLTANQERHPFLVNLHSTFQTETRLYFVMEYVSGGDLMLQIQREPFSEGRARFYACEVLLALEYFHKHNIIYRDLKLDNIMLCLDGHIKLADYGLCKTNMEVNQTTNTFCGTPEFMAPEVLLDQRYGRAVDWWAFGILLYEMLLAQSPFRGEDEEEIFDAILQDEITYPVGLSASAISICQALLERSPERRLGGIRGDANEVKVHRFFAGVNWDDVLAKRITPPFLPRINGREDTSNFDEEFTREIPILTPVNAMLTTPEQKTFNDFSYVAHWALNTHI